MGHEALSDVCIYTARTHGRFSHQSAKGHDWLLDQFEKCYVGFGSQADNTRYTPCPVSTFPSHIARTGGEKLPLAVFSTVQTDAGGNMLVMEILDVKQAGWPEPSEKVCK